MRSSKSILVAAAAVTLACAAQAGSFDAGRYTFNWDNAFWAGSTFSASGGTFTFANLGYSASINEPSAGYHQKGASYYKASSHAVWIIADPGVNIVSVDTAGDGWMDAKAADANGGARVSVQQGTGWGRDWGDPNLHPLGLSYDAEGLKRGNMGNSGTAGPYALSSTAAFSGTVAQAFGSYWSRGDMDVQGFGAVSVSATHDTAYFTVHVTGVPEPRAYEMLLVGAVLMGVFARRRTGAWAAAGFEDTLVGCSTKPEVVPGNESTVQPGVRA